MQHPLEELVINSTYPYRYLLQQFGGQSQRGICTPRKFQVILLFSTSSGHRKHQYSDDLKDGRCIFWGEGKPNSSTVLKRGNKAIATHKEAGKLLLLFVSSPNDIGSSKELNAVFKGVFDCISYDYVDGRFRFLLEPIDVSSVNLNLIWNANCKTRFARTTRAEH